MSTFTLGVLFSCWHKYFHSSYLVGEADAQSPSTVITVYHFQVGVNSVVFFNATRCFSQADTINSSNVNSPIVYSILFLHYSVPEGKTEYCNTLVKVLLPWLVALLHGFNQLIVWKLPHLHQSFLHFEMRYYLHKSSFLFYRSKLFWSCLLLTPAKQC